MRQQTHRLMAGAACAQGFIHRVGQAPSLVFQRTPPIKREGDHFVRIGQALDEVVIHAADGAISFNVRCGGGVPGQAL